MDNWISRFRNAKTVPEYDKVYIPGDLERLMEAERLENGIPLLPAVVEDLTQLGKKFELELLTKD